MKFADRIKRLLFPARCCGCDRVIRDGCLCDDCRKLAVHPSGKRSRCDVCFLPAKECICGKNLFYDALDFIFFNEGSRRKTVYKLKFAGRRDLAESYGKLLAEGLKERELADKTDVITAIPMSKPSLDKRGYNQAEEIAIAISKEIGIEYKPLLYKCMENSRQHDLGRVARTGNVLGAFEPFKEAAEDIDGKNILVVDDIITGGSTANEAAKTLKIFGADNVYIAVVAATKIKTKTEKD